MVESSLKIALVMQRSGQREIAWSHVARVDSNLQRRAHCLDVSFVQHLALDARKCPPCLAEPVVRSNGAAVGVDRLCTITSQPQAVTKSHPHGRVRGIVAHTVAVQRLRY